MPRITRRSDDPSAAPQSDTASEVTAATDEPDEDGNVEKPPAAQTTPASTRRRPPTRTADASNDGADDSNEYADPVTDASPKPVGRRTPRRPGRVPKSEAVDAVERPSDDEFADSDPEGSQPQTDVRPPVPIRRRVGGRRTAQEAAASSRAEPVSGDPTDAEAAAPSGRNRRRRGGHRRPEQTEPSTAPILDTEPADPLLLELALDTTGAAEEPVIAEDERKRSRRSRRGGRRRSAKPGDGEAAEESETVAVVEIDAEDVESALPVFSAPLPFKSSPLVPTPASLELTPSEPRVTARLAKNLTGFEIDGVVYDPELFFVNAETADDVNVVAQQIALAAGVGIHLHSGVAYLPLKNAYGARSFNSVEGLIKQVLDIDPAGYIFVRLQLVPTNFWARTHTAELALYSDGSNGDVSFASRAFWEDAVDAVAALVAYLADPNTPGGDRVIGIHLDKGEWFNDANAGYDYSGPNKLAFQEWLHERYQNVYALRAAWFSGTAEFDTADIPKWPGSPATRKKEEVVLYCRPKERRTVDYNAFTSDLMALAITGMADAIKWLSQGKLLVGTSYGYTFEFATRNDSGHQSLAKVFACQSVDFVAGPNSYASRQAGAAGAFSSPVDSALLHGKMWIVEDDTKTFLAADETEDAFNPKVANSHDTFSVLRRNASAAFIHKCGICWMDLWGNGWLNSPDIWNEISELRSQASIVRRLHRELGSVPEVAVLVDEASYNYVCGDPTGVMLQTALITKSRELIYRSGASIGFYLQSDVGMLPDGVKLYIFLNPLRVTTQERQAIREKLQKPGKTLAWLYAPGLFDERGDSPTEISEIVGMPLKAQPWNSHIGTTFTEERHPVTERLHGGKKLGSDEVLNPSYSVADPAAIILGEYAHSGTPSIASKINDPGWKSVFIGEPHLTGELLRGLYRFAGIHVFDVQDDIVHASATGLLLAHSPYTGQRTLHLPKPVAVYSLYEHRLVTQHASTFRAFMRGRSTNFFLFGDIDRIAASLGTTADELREQQAAWKAERESNQQRNPRGRQRDGAGEGESDTDYGSSEDMDAGGGLEDSDVPESETPAPAPAVSALIQSGLIAADIDYVDGEFDQEAGEEEAPASEASPSRNEPMSPSRRRRWNRKRNMQAAKSPSPPAISMEDLLSDLPPRRSIPPKTEE